MWPELTEDQLHNCAWFMIIMGLLSAFYTQFYKLPYGRYATTSWGFAIDAKLAWIIQETPSFAIPFVMLFSDYRLLTFTPNSVLLSMFLLHYFRRSFIYPLTIKKSSPTPFAIFLIALCFCSLNGYIQGRYLTKFASYPFDWFYTPRFLIGSSLFFIGFIINIHSDNIVTSLRKPGETGHKIPRGGLFEYVSAANFFGEIVEWGGFAMACSSFVSLAFFISTFLVVSTRGYHHHKYYQEKFEDYPKSRKAIIPFIF